MPQKLAIIHSTPVTIEPLGALAAELLDGAEVVNLVDDSILPQLRENGGDLAAVEPRLVRYARIAEGLGVDAILSACSSVGPLAEALRAAVDVPVVRIDEAMAEAAVARARRIGVAATLATTLVPTLALLQDAAREAGRADEIVFEPLRVDAAYERLAAGDREGHDAVLAEALADLATRCDVVVLAQASMARVVPALDPEVGDRFLTSPRLGMERVRSVLSSVPGRG